MHRLNWLAEQPSGADGPQRSFLACAKSSNGRRSPGALGTKNEPSLALTLNINLFSGRMSDWDSFHGECANILCPDHYRISCVHHTTTKQNRPRLLPSAEETPED